MQQWVQWEHMTGKEFQGETGAGSCVCSHTTLAPGYSVAVLQKARGSSYVAGAPRHKLRGAVFELQQDGEATFVRQVEGEQVPLEKVPCPP